MLLEILDAVKPNLNLAKNFPLWVIPLDTIKEVNKKGAVKEINYRPSRERKIKYRLKQMNKNQRKAFYLLSNNEDADISFLKDKEKADVLETAYQYVQYQYVAKDLSLKEYRQKSFKLLHQRNKNKKGQTFDDLKEGNDPKDAHDSAMVGLGVGTTNGSVFEELFFRPAYHSLTDNPFGYLKGAAINFLEFYFRHYDHHDKYVFEKLNVLELDSLSPIKRGFTAPSYRIKLDWERTYNLNEKKTGYAFKGELSGGGTIGLTDDFFIYTLSSMDGAYGGFLKHNAYAGLGVSGGFLYVGNKISLQAELKKVWATTKQGSVFEQKGVLDFHLWKNTSLEASLCRKTLSSKSLTETKIGLKQFF